jgi:hypothetical protein
MALFSIAGIAPENGFIILKRMPISEKLTRLRFFVEIQNSPRVIHGFSPIVQRLQIFTKIRNTVAHGYFLGLRRGTNELAFSIPTDYILPPEGSHEFVNKVVTITEQNIKRAIAEGQFVRDRLMEVFRIAPYHETGGSQFHSQKPAPRKRKKK